MDPPRRSGSATGCGMSSSVCCAKPELLSRKRARPHIEMQRQARPMRVLELQRVMKSGSRFFEADWMDLFQMMSGDVQVAVALSEMKKQGRSRERHEWRRQ